MALCRLYNFDSANLLREMKFRFLLRTEEQRVEMKIIIKKEWKRDSGAGALTLEVTERQASKQTVSVFFPLTHVAPSASLF